MPLIRTSDLDDYRITLSAKTVGWISAKGTARGVLNQLGVDA